MKEFKHPFFETLFEFTDLRLLLYLFGKPIAYYASTMTGKDKIELIAINTVREPYSFVKA